MNTIRIALQACLFLAVIMGICGNVAKKPPGSSYCTNPSPAPAPQNPPAPAPQNPPAPAPQNPPAPAPQNPPAPAPQNPPASSGPCPPGGNDNSIINNGNNSPALISVPVVIANNKF